METLMVPGMTERARVASEARRNDILTMALSELHLASARPVAAPAGHAPRPATIWKRITTAIRVRGRRPWEETLSEHAFDTFTRHAATGVSRRASVLALGTLGLAAIAAPISTDAKKKNKKKRKKKQQQQEQSEAARQANEACRTQLGTCTAEIARCADQVEPCSSFLTASCGGDPGCTYLAPCCSFLGECDMSGFLACLSVRPS
jgi:hypothetical protein